MGACPGGMGSIAQIAGTACTLRLVPNREDPFAAAILTDTGNPRLLLGE